MAGATTGIGTTMDIASSVAVVIGEGTMTQVTFTDTDPPAGSSVGGPPVVVSNPGGSNAGTTIGITASVALSVSKTVSKSVSKSTGNAVTRALRRDEALLATLKLEIKMTERALAKAHGAVHRHLSKRLSALMARERVLLEAIKYLK